MSDLSGARVALLEALRQRRYSFITPTPATHARVLARADKQQAHDLRGVFGWSLPFPRDQLDADLFSLAERAAVLVEQDGLFISRFRVSSLGDDLLLHSAYPTTQHDAVFFGPDSYRFAAFLGAELPRFGPVQHLVDIGAGAGAGALAAMRCAEIAHLTLTDINQTALDLARANFRAAGRTADTAFVKTNALDAIDAPVQLIIANPPYIVDPVHRAYRDGGGLHGAEISLHWARAAAEKLQRGGALLLYTGSAMVNGADEFEAALHTALPGFDIKYREIDPDVFGEELERADYVDVERIAVVGVVAVKT